MSEQTPAGQTCEFVRLEVADGIGTIRLDLSLIHISESTRRS